MRTKARMAMALAVLATSAGLSLTMAAPASACTGDPCDGFCITYNGLPTAVKQKVFHSDTCPLR